MNGTDFGGLPGYVLGVDPENGDDQVEGQHDPGPGRARA